MGRPAIDETGSRYGRLTVVGRAPATSRNASWLCECDCGEITTVTGACLRGGDTRSCGCYRSERTAETRTVHGHATAGLTRTYQSWRSMKARCTNPNETRWPDYGGRGITVCEQWLLSFEAFLEDMGEPPPDPPDWTGRRAYWSLDRIDPDGGYEPANCRWATPIEQANNKRIK